MADTLIMTKNKKIDMINEIMSGKKLKEIKEKYKGSIYNHYITRNIKNRNDLITKMNLSSDNELYIAYDLIVLNNNVRQYMLDNNIIYRSLDSVIYNIDSINEKKTYKYNGAG